MCPVVSVKCVKLSDAIGFMPGARYRVVLARQDSNSSAMELQKLQ
jgi:hypothetical protein